MQADKVVAPADVEPLLTSLQERGLGPRFRCRPNGFIECNDCGHANPADDMPLLAVYRVDGTLGAQEGQEGEEVITVLRCGDCSKEGFLVFAQGPMSSRDEAVCLAELCSEQ